MEWGGGGVAHSFNNSMKKYDIIRKYKEYFNIIVFAQHDNTYSK